MAKVLKSIFHTTDRRKAPPSHYNDHEGDEERSDSPSPQSTSKRQLSISRSGRMRQANKKRHSLTLELYGETIQIDAVEKPKTREYHVDTPSHTAPAILEGKSRFGTTVTAEVHPKGPSTEFDTFDVVPLERKLRTVDNDDSPEEEIDRAFEILDKS